MEIRTIRKEFEAFENVRSILKQILTFRKGFEAFKCKFEPFESDSNHSNANANDSKGIQSIQMQIETIRKGFESFECKSNKSKGIEAFETIRSILIEVLTTRKEFEGIRMQIRTIRKIFEAFESKFEPFERDSKR